MTPRCPALLLCGVLGLGACAGTESGRARSEGVRVGWTSLQDGKARDDAFWGGRDRRWDFESDDGLYLGYEAVMNSRATSVFGLRTLDYTWLEDNGSSGRDRALEFTAGARLFLIPFEEEGPVNLYAGVDVGLVPELDFGANDGLLFLEVGISVGAVLWLTERLSVEAQLRQYFATEMLIFSEADMRGRQVDLVGVWWLGDAAAPGD